MVAHEWVVVQLTPKGEEEDPEVLTTAIKRLIKTAEVFVPASISKVGDSRVIHRLVDGYLFIRRTDTDQVYFRLENTKYVDYILTTRTTTDRRSVRKIATIPESEIDKMRRQVHVETEQGINIGDEVQVTSGVYRGINCRVIEEIKENETVQVHIKLRSKEAIVTLPRSYLKFSSKGDGAVPSFSPFATKIARIRDWAQRASPVATWRPLQPFPQLLAGKANLQQLTSWVSRLGQFFRLFHFYKSPPDFSVISGKMLLVDRLSTWEKSHTYLLPHVSLSKASPENLSLIEKKRAEVQWLSGVVKRLEGIDMSTSAVEGTLTSRSPDMIQNIIVDGHNLAYRVYYALNAPTSKPMSDAQGRPTSIIFGVLKSLASLQKRFPEAQLYVCWDGAPTRRKRMFAEYKANRPARSLNGASDFNQIEYLREVLPALGVNQTFNPEEETDDIIACLVKGPLQGQNNLIVSTDHDFMQLVTRTDVLMVPKVGSRPEALYDPDAVMSEYGVEPQKVVQLRALMGSADASDNLKGIPRVPTKVLVNLVKLHGSVDAIYSSSLAGVTPNQFEKILAAKSQVKLNVELMTLRADLSYSFFEGKFDSREADQLLAEVGIQAKPILESFSRSVRGFEKHS